MKILTNIVFKGEFSPAFMNRCYETFSQDIDGLEIVWKKGNKVVDSFMKSNQGVILRNGKNLLTIREKGEGVLHLKSVQDKEAEIFRHVDTLHLLSERKSIQTGCIITIIYIIVLFLFGILNEDIDQLVFRLLCFFCILLVIGFTITYSAVSNQAGDSKINTGLIIAFIGMLGLAPLSLVNIYLLSAIRDKYFYERMEMFKTLHQ